MAEDFQFVLGATIDESGLDAKLANIRKKISESANPAPIILKMDSSDVTRKLTNIKNQIQSLSNIRITLFDGKGTGSNTRTSSEITKAYNDLVNLQNRINAHNKQRSLLDPVKDKQAIKEIDAALLNLNSRAANIHAQFDGFFSAEMLAKLNRGIETTTEKIGILKAGLSDTSAAKAQKEAMQELASAADKINKLEIRIGGLKATGTHGNEVAQLEAQLNELKNTYSILQQMFNGQSVANNPFQSFSAGVETFNAQLRSVETEAANVKARLADTFSTSFGKGGDATYSSLESKFNGIKTKSDECVTAFNAFKTAHNELKAAIESGDVEGIIAKWQAYQTALQNASIQIKQNTEAEREAAKAQKEAMQEQLLTQRRQSLSDNMSLWLKNNSAAAREFGVEISRLQAELQSCDAQRLNGIKAEFDQIKYKAEMAGQATLSFADRLRNQFSKLGVYFTASMMISYAIRALRDMYQNTLSVDKAMTELYRVTNLTDKQYADMYDNMVQSAKDYGVQLDTLINSTASWVRLGFDEQLSIRLAEITAMYQHVTDLDEKTAVNNLVTAYKGFQDQLDQIYQGDTAAAIESIADIYDKLGNEFAESAADVGDGLSKSASVLNEAGNTIQESVAMFTGIQEVLQDSSMSGSALKILTMRLRGMKGELQELGEEVDENVESVSKMQTQILNMTHGKVNIFNDDGSFKSTYEIMSEIAEVYDSLSDPDRANLLETIAGKNRANAVAALIKNWKNVEKALDAANNAQGTAAAENEKYLDSLEGHINRLETAWQSLSADFLKSDFLKGFIDGLTDLVNLLDKVVASGNGLPMLAGLFSTFQAFSKNGVGELIKQFRFLITLRSEYAHKSFLLMVT